jgi:hypothetical protein
MTGGVSSATAGHTLVDNAQSTRAKHKRRKQRIRLLLPYLQVPTTFRAFIIAASRAADEALSHEFAALVRVALRIEARSFAQFSPPDRKKTPIHS